MLFKPTLALAASLGLGLASLPGALADYTLTGGKLAVVSSTGITADSTDFSTVAPASSSSKLKVSSLDTLKLSFVIGADDEESPKPHQVAVLATGTDSGRSWTGLVKVRRAGKAKWELDLTRAPTSLLNLSPTGAVTLELLVADFGTNHKPLKASLGSIQLDKSIVLPYPFWDTKDGKPPAHLELEKYATEPNQEWTFREAEKPVNAVIALVFSFIALTPWALLLGAWSSIAGAGSSKGFSLTSAPSSSTFLFLLSILAQEVLIVVYWVGLRLYQYLPLAALLSVPLVLTGRSALGELRLRRAQRPILEGVGLRSTVKGKAE